MFAEHGRRTFVDADEVVEEREKRTVPIGPAVPPSRGWRSGSGFGRPSARSAARWSSSLLRGPVSRVGEGIRARQVPIFELSVRALRASGARPRARRASSLVQAPTAVSRWSSVSEQRCERRSARRRSAEPRARGSLQPSPPPACVSGRRASRRPPGLPRASRPLGLRAARRLAAVRGCVRVGEPGSDAGRVRERAHRPARGRPTSRSRSRAAPHRSGERGRRPPPSGGSRPRGSTRSPRDGAGGPREMRRSGGLGRAAVGREPRAPSRRGGRVCARAAAGGPPRGIVPQTPAADSRKPRRPSSPRPEHGRSCEARGRRSSERPNEPG